MAEDAAVTPPEPPPCPSWCETTHPPFVREPGRSGMVALFHHSDERFGRSVVLMRRDEWFEHEAVRAESWNKWRTTTAIHLFGVGGAQVVLFQVYQYRTLQEFEPLLAPELADQLREAAMAIGWE